MECRVLPGGRLIGECLGLLAKVEGDHASEDIIKILLYKLEGGTGVGSHIIAGALSQSSDPASGASNPTSSGLVSATGSNPNLSKPDSTNSASNTSGSASSLAAASGIRSFISRNISGDKQYFPKLYQSHTLYLQFIER